MQELLVFLAVALLSVLASNARLLESGRAFQLAQLSASGLLFLLLGVVAGPGGTGLLGAAKLAELRPLTSLGLGVGGALIGLSFDPRVFRKLPLAVYFSSALQAACTTAVVAIPMAGALYFATGLGAAVSVGAAMLLGAAASVSSGHLAILWQRKGRLDVLRGTSVFLLALLDDLWGLWALALGLVFAAAPEPSTGVALVCLAALLGIASGALVAFLIHGLSSGPELMAMLMGGLALMSGAAAYLKLSALLCGLFWGLTLVLIGGPAIDRLYRTLVRFERPIYLVLVFLIGAHVELTGLIAWALLPSFVGLRFAGKLWGGDLALRAARGVLALPPKPGYALLAQGGVSLCLLADFLSMAPGEAAQVIFPVGVLAAVVNEILAAKLFARSLEPEVQPSPVGGAA